MSEFSLKIISPESVIFEGKCASLIFEAPDGKYGIQAHHAPVISAVKAGEVIIKGNDGESTVTVAKGILRFEDNSAVILTENG